MTPTSTARSARTFAWLLSAEAWCRWPAAAFAAVVAVAVAAGAAPRACAQGSAVTITEFMASNGTTLADGDGVFSDWIEVRNAGDAPVDLAGWHLTDSADDLTGWTFPSVVVAPGGYLVVFASGRDPASPIDGEGGLHASFRLAADGEFLALVEPDGVTVATEFRPAFPPQEEDVSFGTPDGVRWGYYAEPTPGAANGGVVALADPVTISPPGGVFAGSLEIVLASPESLPPEAAMRFTLDGSPVTAASPAYAGPFVVTGRTHLRARVFRDGFEPGPESGAVFVRASSEVVGFTSNLPVVVVDTDGAIPPTTASNLVGAHALVFDTVPETGRSAVAAAPDHAVRSGLRVRGRSSAGFPKKQYKFETWDAEGEEVNVSLLGMGGESDWVLHGPYTDKSLMRNALAYATWKKLGWPSVDTRLVEVFLNQDRDTQLSYADDYVGVYLLVEGITIDDDRVDIAWPEDTSDPAAITGGFIIETGNADSQQFTTTGSRRSVAHRFKDPNIDRLNGAQRQWIRNFIQQFEEALYAPDFRHPTTHRHYSELTDVASQVDYKIVREWTRNFDGGSTFSFVDRGGKLTMSPVWDFNWALGNVNYAEGGDLPGYRTDGWNRSFTANLNGWAPWWLRMEEDPDWWQAFIDRWSDLRETVLSDAAIDADIEAMAALLEAEGAADRNFERWRILGTFTSISPPGWQTRTTFRSEVDYLREWLRDRSAWIDSQFPGRLSFVPAGGAVSADRPARLVSPDERGTLQFTTDGSDPRLPGGGVNPSARSLPAGSGVLAETLVGSASTVAALRPDGPSPGPTAWTAPGFDDASWTTGANGVGYENSPSDYADLIGTPIGFFPGGQPTSVYVRCRFEVTDPGAFTRLVLRVKYDDGFIAYLNGSEVARRNAPDPVEWNSAATAAHPPDESDFPFEEIDLSPVLAAPAGEGLVAGTNVLAIHALNLGTPNAGNTGSPDSDMLMLPELVGERLSDEAGALPLEASAVVTARALDGSVWGPPARAVFVVGRPPASAANLVISELHFHPAPPTAEETAARPGISHQDLEWIELRNISEEPVDLTGVGIVNGIGFDFAPGTLLEPGAFLVVAADPQAFAVRHPDVDPPLGPWDGALANDGERVAVLAADGSPIADFRYRDDWHPLADGPGHTLVLVDENRAPASYATAAAWGASDAVHGSPGAPNGPVLRYTFDSWLPRFFTAEEIAAGIVTAPGADGDGDGLTTLAEFALGRDPRVPDTAPHPALVVGGSDAQPTAGLAFTRPLGRSGVTIDLESSSDLSAWTRDAEALVESVDLGDGTERVSVMASVPPPPSASGGARWFLRLRIQVAAP